MGKARRLYAGEELGLELANTVYALDSTTIDLSLTLFPWADFRRTKAGIKLHTQLDLRGPIPTCLHITEARQHDVLWLDRLVFEPGAFYVMDRGYLDFQRLNRLARAGAFFVTRAKGNLRFSRQCSHPVDLPPTAPGGRDGWSGKSDIDRSARRNSGRGATATKKPRRLWPGRACRFDRCAIPSLDLYRLRWQVELFFRWIKGHLRIKHYYGTSPNAVKTQIWIAVTVYLLVAITHKQLKLPGTLHRTLQLLSIHPFEKTSLHELLTETNLDVFDTGNHNHLKFNCL